MRLIYPITVSILLVSLYVLSAGASDTMNIKDLKANAMSYQLRTVTLHGTVKNLRVFPPHPGRCAPCMVRIPLPWLKTAEKWMWRKLVSVMTNSTRLLSMKVMT